MDSHWKCETWMSNEYCANCGRTCSHKSIRWVLTEEGKRLLEGIRSGRSAPGGGVDVGSELGGAISGLAARASD